MIDQWKAVIPSLSKDPRRVYVYLPTMYEKEPDRHFPVLYMFDGHNVFFDRDATYGTSWKMGNFLDYTDTPLIVAAVECNPHGNERLKEYAPFSFEMEGTELEGKGRLTMEWLVRVFKPMIDRRYRTLPDRESTFIAGSSMGGLMSLYAISRYNRFFGGAAALSPSAWIAPEKVLLFLKECRYRSDTLLYLDYGSEEMKNHAGNLNIFCSISAYLMKRGVMVTSRIVPGGTHCEASWEKQIPIFLKCLGLRG